MIRDNTHNMKYNTKNNQWKTVAGIAVGASLMIGVTAWSDAPAKNAPANAETPAMSCPMMDGGMMGMMQNGQKMMGGGMMDMMQNCQKMMGGQKDAQSGGMMSCPMMGGGMMGGQSDMAEKPVQATQDGKLRRVAITVDDKGYTPAAIEVQVGKPVELTFTRKSDKTCATEVVMPDYKIKAALPLNKPVKVKFTPKKAGSIAFACGMGMFRGQIIAQ